MDARKLEFINDELSAWAAEVDAELKKALTRMNIGVTDDLYRSLLYQVMRASGSFDGQYQLSFHEYGRFVDMGTGRGGRAKYESMAGNRRKLVGRKPKKFYSKTTYGMLNRLIESIAYGYQEATADTVKEALQ